MGTAATLSAILGLAVAAGVNLYLAVLTIGLSLRLGWLSGVPGDLEILAHPVVLIAAGVLYVADFIADKVPFFTPIWDTIHTVIRPVGAAFLAMSAAARLDPVMQTVAVLAAGSIALGTHSTKMAVRLSAHAVPEPVTHSVISIAEDVGVVALLALAYTHPWVAIPVIAGVILAIGLTLYWIGRKVWRFFFDRKPDAPQTAVVR
ncbi:MAG: DUF4126 domain-containing protein [Bryobacteraceae bacterium]